MNTGLMKHRDAVREQFDRVSGRYDSQRKNLIPCFDAFYSSAVAAADVRMDAPRVLDIGAGTGILSSFIRERYPECYLTLCDIAEKMLSVARERFAGMPRVNYVVGDYSAADLGSGYDLVVSALSIHHLDDGAKRDLYKRINGMLNPCGVFVNADQCLGATPELEGLNRRMWLDAIGKSGLPREEIEGAKERMKLDIMAKLDDQLGWLREAGFVDVGAVYQWFTFTVFTGRKYGQ